MTEEILQIEGIVEQVSQKEGKYGAKIDGAWYNGFGDFTCDEGDKVAIKYKKNKQWNNVESFSLVEKATPQMKTAEELPITSIRRHKLDCLLKSVDCWLAGKIDKKEVIPFGVGLFDALSDPYVEEMDSTIGKKEVEVIKIQ